MSKKVIFYICDGFCSTHFVGGNCIQRQKNTGMIGVSFSKSVSKVRINVWDGSCKTHFWTSRKWLRRSRDHFLGVQKCVALKEVNAKLQKLKIDKFIPSHIWQKTRLWK